MSLKSNESGYESNEDIQREVRVPEINPRRITEDKIRLEKEFIIEKLLMNSANGRIYSGICIPTKSKVVLKQIPRATVTNWKMFENCIVPAEIYYHFRAAQFDKMGVIIRPITWLEKKSSFVLVMEYIEGDELFEIIADIT